MWRTHSATISIIRSFLFLFSARLGVRGGLEPRAERPAVALEITDDLLEHRRAAGFEVLDLGSHAEIELTLELVDRAENPPRGLLESVQLLLDQLEELIGGLGALDELGDVAGARLLDGLFPDLELALPLGAEAEAAREIPAQVLENALELQRRVDRFRLRRVELGKTERLGELVRPGSVGAAAIESLLHDVHRNPPVQTKCLQKCFWVKGQPVQTE